jgi:peptidoglycan hydrolase CwlO-like protein
MQRELAMWRKIGVAIVVSFIALTMTLLGLHNNLLRETISSAKELVEMRQQLQNTKNDLGQLRDQLADTQKEVQQLRQIPPKPMGSK